MKMVNRGGKKKGTKMKAKLRMVYWKSDKFWLGKLVDHPEIMTQGETLKELEENMFDAYKLMLLDDVSGEHGIEEIILSV
jgi:predicted RNase H-like HicB family nuclease